MKNSHYERIKVTTVFLKKTKEIIENLRGFKKVSIHFVISKYSYIELKNILLKLLNAVGYKYSFV